MFGYQTCIADTTTQFVEEPILGDGYRKDTRRNQNRYCIYYHQLTNVESVSVFPAPYNCVYEDKST